MTQTVPAVAPFDFVTSGSRGWAQYYSDAGPLFVRMGNLGRTSIRLDLTDEQRVKPPAGAEGSRTRVRPGDVLVSITADVGMVAVAPENFEEAYINQHVALARPSANVFGPFLGWLLLSPTGQAHLKAREKGATKKGLDLDTLRDIRVALPPQDEQRRIVDAIESSFTRLDAAVMGLNRVRAKLTRYRASMLSAASEGRLLERRAEYKETLLGDIKTFSMYGPRFSREDYSKTGRYILRTSDISESGRVRLDEAPKLDLTDDEFARYRVEVGDLLITRTGSLGTLSVFNDIVEAIPGAYLIQYRVNREIANPWFVFIALKAPRGQELLKGSGAGVGRPNLNAPSIDAIPLLLPSTLAEQERIIAEVERRLSVADALTAEVDLALAKCSRMREALLKKAFEGRLVPQAARDEAAVVPPLGAM